MSNKRSSQKVCKIPKPGKSLPKCKAGSSKKEFRAGEAKGRKKGIAIGVSMAARALRLTPNHLWRVIQQGGKLE